MSIKSRLLPLALLAAATTAAQPVALSLEDCHALALQSNKRVAVAQTEVAQARLEQKVAQSLYLPRVSAMGGYVRSGRSLQLVGDRQLHGLERLGTSAGAQLQQMAAQYPELAQLLAGHEALVQSLVTPLNDVGQNLANALSPDGRNAVLAAVTLTQALYMGGKIRAANRIREHALNVSRLQQDLLAEDILVEVDETYWKIITLQEKLRLAQGYLRLVEQLRQDVEKMRQEGFTTQADLLSVKVKVNEAKVSVIQVDNGLAITRMMLCQLCGLPLESDITLTDSLSSASTALPFSGEQVRLAAQSRRLELRLLDEATAISREKEKVSRAEYLPHLALLGPDFVVGTPKLSIAR